MRWKSHVRFGGRAGETHHGERRAGRSGPTPTRDERGVVRRRPEDRARRSPRDHVPGCSELSESWFYKWRDRAPTRRQQRRADLDAAVKRRSTRRAARYGSPRVLADLRRGRVAGVEEERRGVDGPPGSRGSADRDAAPLA